MGEELGKEQSRSRLESVWQGQERRGWTDSWETLGAGVSLALQAEGSFLSRPMGVSMAEF